MNFGNKTKEHLENYKISNFPGLQDGLWKKNKQPYPHILPENNKLDNLLPTYRAKLVKHIDGMKIKLHSDFHHLNSSQAMCFNFFFPLYYEQTLELVSDLLGFKDEKVIYDTVRFEKDGLEAQFGRRPTSFDFYFETTLGKKLYFEIKYTESEFGKAEINSDKFNDVYSKFLKPIRSSFHNPQQFFNNYQILRNLIHIDDNSFVIFVYPKDNEGVSKETDRVKTDFLLPSFHDNFFAVTWEKLFESVSNSITNKQLRVQLSNFKDKYLF